MKRKLLISLLLVSVLLLALPLSAQAFDDGSLCMAMQNGKHDWRLESSVEATCTEDGSRTYKCRNCGNTGTEVVPALGHGWVDDSKEPTCTQDSYNGAYCYRCGEKGRYTTVPALGHDIRTFEATPATCTEPGSTASSYCARCAQGSQARRERVPVGRSGCGRGQAL